VVTGIGVVSPIGIGKEEFVQALKSGKSGIDNVTYFDVSKVKSKLGYLVEEFNINSIDKDFLKNCDGLELNERSFMFALHAVLQALSDAQIDLIKYDKNRVSINMGASLAGNNFLECYIRGIRNNENPDPKLLMYGVGNIHTFLSRMLGVCGIGTTVSTACASGGNSIGIGFDLIKKGIIDMAIVGGTDCFTSLVHGGFNALQALDEESCRPFSKDRAGTILAEGAGVLILEDLEVAIQRNAPIYAEILGYAISNDAYHITAPDPTGQGAMNVMESAINNSNIHKKDINYINTHGTGTPTNDSTEVKAIKNLFGEHLSNVYVNSNKSQFGHLLAAAGSMEAVATVLQIHHQFISPTINVKKADLIDDEVNFIIGESISESIKVGISNSFGFGGNNTCLVMGIYENH
jgi:3-oxoacyl-[acyl-carrier-protein] synthase II